MNFVRSAVAALTIAIAWISPASAEWRQASSSHFIVYSDQPENRLREFTERLERFDSAVRVIRNMPDPQLSPSMKVAVYFVPNTDTVQRLVGMREAAGFYRAIVEGPMAVVPRKSGGGDRDLDPETILYHEYAHHLLLSDLDQPIPQWLSEGFAEFFSTPDFEKDGSITLGRWATHRLMTFGYGTYLPVETMLADEASRDQLPTLYAQGWLLTHYLTFDKSRRGQLTAFLADVAAGMKGIDAARKNFGNLRTLEEDLNGYLRHRSLSALRIDASKIKPVKLDVRPLSPGAAAVMPWRIASKSGVNKKTAPIVAGEVRRVAASYPNDPMVLLTMAETEIDADNYAASEAAADRLLAVDPKSVDAMVFKGRAIMERAKKAGGDYSDAFDEARRWFIAANRIDKEDPEPLTYYYRSYKLQGIAPSRNAVNALHYASSLMPQDDSVRLLSAIQYARDNQIADARQQLGLLAYSAHHGDYGKMVQSMMAKLAAGDGKGAAAIAEEAQKKAEAEANKD